MVIFYYRYGFFKYLLSNPTIGATIKFVGKIFDGYRLFMSKSGFILISQYFAASSINFLLVKLAL